MKVALCEASDERKEGRVFYPLGLAYLASYLEKTHPGVDVEIFRSIDKLVAWRPDLAGVSSVSPDFGRASTLCAEIAAGAGCAVILGGAHVSALPSTLPDACAAGVIGEGEATFAEIVGMHVARRAPSPSDYAEIPGIVFRDGDDLVLTAPRGLIAPLDALPFPRRRWEGLEKYVHWSFSSRGCPYRCVFCASSSFWERLRTHSPSYVADELATLVERFGIAYHTFMDDLFSADRQRLEVIAGLMRERMPRPLELTVTVRANLVDDALAAILAGMGVKYAHLGLESGSDRIVKFLKGDNSSVEENQRALDTLTGAGIHCVGSFILGAPGETADDMEATWRFIDGNLAAGTLMSFTLGPLVPFPGTGIWEHARKRGLIDITRFDWQCLDIDLRWFDRERYLLLNGEVSRELFFSSLDRFGARMAELHGTLPATQGLSPAES